MAKKRNNRDASSGPSAASPVGSCRQYPYSLVWAPIPLLTWILPCLGHLGVCSSDGTILDFSGHFTVTRDVFLFGRPTRYLQLEPRSAFAVLQGIEGDEESGEKSYSWAQGTLSSIGQGWDALLDTTADQFEAYTYNILTNNCHCFVAHFLNVINYDGHSAWNPIQLAAWLFFKGRYVGWTGVFKTWLPFCLLVPSGVYFGRQTFALCYAGICIVLVAWFLLYYSCFWRPPAIVTGKSRRRAGS